MRYFVIGSNSFTGSHFVKHVLQQPASQVLGTSRSPEYHDVLCAYRYQQKPSDRFAFRQLDVNTETDAVLKLIDDFEPDYVLNFSAQGEVRNSWNWPEQWWATNCMSVVKLTSALVNKKYLKKYIAVSTPEVYGATGEGLAENHSYQQSTPYAASKLAGDLHLMTLQKRYGFPVCYTRAANLYGIHQQLYRIIPRTIIYSKLGKTLELHGGGRARRAFIHARDVASATQLICQKGRIGEVYHLTPKNEVFSIADVVRTVCGIGGFDFSSLVTMVDENFGQDEVFSMSGEKIWQELGWKPAVSFREGIAETIEWINCNWGVINSLSHDYNHKV